MKENELRDTAHHEAGHAVAAWWYGQLKKKDHVTVIPDPQTGSLGHLRNPPIFISEMEKSDSGRARLQAEKFLVVCLAGNAASCHHQKTKSRYLAGGRTDREQAVEVLGHLVWNNEELEAYFHLLQIRSENLVARFWPEVEAVAKRLLSEKTLTSDQIRETCLSARFSLRQLERSSLTRDTIIRARRGERVHPATCMRLAEIMQELERKALRV